MIPAPRPSPERVVPCPVGHRGVACVLTRGHSGTCVPAPSRIVRREVAA